jgi:hypothetical protein
MADEILVRMLRKQGVEAWNEWRKRNPKARIRLSQADLNHTDLKGANLNRANLSGARMVLWKFAESDLRHADLSNAELSGADMRRAYLRSANLKNANLQGAYLCGTNLRNAFLMEANLRSAQVSGANFARSSMLFTSLTNLDLSGVEGLEKVSHMGYSEVGISTIYRSRGNIPEVFLRGCGVPEDFINYLKSLVDKPIEFYSCFISYSSKDQEFAERLHADLQSKGVRCWFAPEDLKIGAWAATLRRTRHIGEFNYWKGRDRYKKAFDRLLRDLKADGKADVGSEVKRRG